MKLTKARFDAFYILFSLLAFAGAAILLLNEYLGGY
jgi:hypothetical protein